MDRSDRRVSLGRSGGGGDPTHIRCQLGRDAQEKVARVSRAVPGVVCWSREHTDICAGWPSDGHISKQHLPAHRCRLEHRDPLRPGHQSLADAGQGRRRHIVALLPPKGDVVILVQCIAPL